jgi:hypothetical protein
VTDTMGIAPSAHRAGRPAAKEAWGADASFYLTMSVVAAALLLVGFAPSFYLKSVFHHPPTLSFLIVFHALVATSWLALFVTQAALINAKNNALHRQLGVVGMILFGAFSILGICLAIRQAQLGLSVAGVPPLAFAALPMIQMCGATGMVGYAVWDRRRVDRHKRLMLGSLFVLTESGVVRIWANLGFHPELALGISWLVPALMVAVCMIYDYRKYKTVHPAYVAAGVVMAACYSIITWAFSGAPAWMAFASLVTRD